MYVPKHISARLKRQKQVDWRAKRAKEQKGLCFYCKKEMKNAITLDHVIPLSKGGADHWENVVASCYKCNHSKADKV